MEPIKQVEIEKTYDANLETMWEAWTNPQMIKQWWGPDNVMIPECEIDARVGGKFYVVMEATEAMGPYKGTKWPMMAEFTEVVPKAKLSYTAQAWTEGAKETMTIDQGTEVTFSETDSKTNVKIKAIIYKSGPDAQTAIDGMQYGFSQQMEKLNKFLSAKK